VTVFKILKKALEKPVKIKPIVPTLGVGDRKGVGVRVGLVI
jgi:hypothetical protein